MYSSQYWFYYRLWLRCSHFSFSISMAFLVFPKDTALSLSHMYSFLPLKKMVEFLQSKQTKNTHTIRATPSYKVTIFSLFGLSYTQHIVTEYLFPAKCVGSKSPVKGIPNQVRTSCSQCRTCSLVALITVEIKWCIMWLLIDCLFFLIKLSIRKAVPCSIFFMLFPLSA